MPDMPVNSGSWTSSLEVSSWGNQSSHDIAKDRARKATRLPIVLFGAMIHLLFPVSDAGETLAGLVQQMALLGIGEQISFAVSGELEIAPTQAPTSTTTPPMTNEAVMASPASHAAMTAVATGMSR